MVSMASADCELSSIGAARVTASVTRTTTLLIVGDQDIRQLAGHEKSNKHRKAEWLIEK
jgi:DNA polymerase-3 subunit epsilon